ncbi:MAG TPA: hypothetical protein VHS09_10910, partial [Polyangiaceae bacterium]|nr:hypothetical protein [Polyangiaceae bacterium]
MRSATGTVSIVQSRVPGPSSNAVAYFFDTTYADPTQREPCVGQDPAVGGCSVCVSRSSDGRGSHTTRPLAGPITVSVGAHPLRLQPSRDAYGSVPAPALRGGEAVHFEASGDPAGVPAFSGQVVAPIFVTLAASSILH